MNAYELKNHIIDNNLLLDTLEKIGCENIKSYSNEYRCSYGIYTNPTSIRVKKDSLKVNIFHSSGDVYGDIYTLLMVADDMSFPQAFEKICNLHNINPNFKPIKKKRNRMLDIFKEAKALSGCGYTQDCTLEVYSEPHPEIIEIPYLDWVREGILPKTQEIFGVGICTRTNRVTIPHRYWCGKDGEYVGIMGRTLNKNYELLGIPKYFPIIRHTKSFNLYGLQENYRGIQEAGYVVVFEAEKSVMKRHSRLDYTGVAISGHTLSDEQIAILIGLDVEIILAYDKDIPESYVRNECARFRGIRKVSYMIDNKYDLLGEKDSPADARNMVYKYLFKNRKEYRIG